MINNISKCFPACFYLGQQFPPLNNKQAVHLGLLGARNSENKSIHTIIFAYLFNSVQLGPSLMKKLVYTPTTTYYP